MEQRASVGRIVHWKASPDAPCVAAIVTGVREEPAVVDLTVFGPGAPVLAYVSQPQDEAQERNGAGWHWPERT